MTNRWNIAAASAALLAAGAFAQQPEELKKELEALKATVAQQSQRIAELENGQTGEAKAAALESEINRVSDRMAEGTVVASAANRLIFSGEYRFRSYLELGENAAGVERDGYWNSTKIRIGILYEFSKNVSAYSDIQSTFSFGHNGHSSTGAGLANADPGEPLHICQAWVKTSNLFGAPELSAKLGRQSVTLGNQYQFGNADWYNGYFFDGLRADWSADSFSFAAMMLRTSTANTNDGNQVPAYGPFGTNGDGHDHDEYYLGYFTLKSIKNHELDLYWIYANWNEGATVNSVGQSAGAFAGGATFAPASFHTLGARMGGKVDVAAGLDWNLEAAYQTGELDAGGGDLDVDAFSAEGEVGVTFAKENAIRAWIRGLWAQGPEAGETGYIPLAPTRHSNTAAFRARYGQMDVIPMNDVFALTGGVHFDPAKDWTLGVTGVWAQRESDQPANVDDSFGFEIDVWGEYRYSDQLTFSGGVSFLFPDDQLDGTAAPSPLIPLNGTFDSDAQVMIWAQARLFF